MAALGDRLTSLGIAVALVFIVFLGVTSILFKVPSYDDFYSLQNSPATKEDCIAAGGIWDESPPTGWANCGYYADLAYDTARKNFELYTSAVSFVLAVVFILIGLFAKMIPAAVSNGFFGGGILLLLGGSYILSVTNTSFSVSMSLVVLAALIYAAYRRSKKSVQKK